MFPATSKPDHSPTSTIFCFSQTSRSLGLWIFLHLAPFTRPPVRRPYSHAVPADKRLAERAVLAAGVVQIPAFRTVPAMPLQVLSAQRHALPLQGNRRRPRRNARQAGRNARGGAVGVGLDESAGGVESLERVALLLDVLLRGVSPLALLAPSISKLAGGRTCGCLRGNCRASPRSGIYVEPRGGGYFSGISSRSEGGSLSSPVLCWAAMWSRRTFSMAAKVQPG